MNRITPLLLITIASALACSEAAHAQRRGPGGQAGGPQGSLSGTIIDSASNEPLGGATVALRNAADSALVTGDIAGKDGKFSITGIRPGRYYARISYVGYVTRFIDVAVMPGQPQVALGEVKLGADPAFGKGVSISARREFMSQQIDRTVYATGDMPVASGGTATDVLRNIPSIEVDSDGKVSLRGNQNVVIQINGRPTMMNGDALASFLQSLPSSSVERIEVMPNPSAKYDPDGMSGIINIVLKQDGGAGLSGGVNGSVGTGNNYTAGGNISYGTGPWRFFANYGFNYNTRQNDGSYYRENHLPTVVPYLSQSSSNTRTSPSHVLNGSVDYMFNASNTLSFSAVVTRRTSDRESSTFYDESDSARTLVRRSERTNGGDGASTDMDYRLAYKTVFEPTKHELSVEARYATDDDSDDDSYMGQDLSLDGSGNDQTPDRQQVSTMQRHKTLTAQADYTKTLGAETRIEAGYKGELERLNSDFYSETFDYGSSAFRPDLEMNNTFVFDRTIHAVYANLGQDFGPLSAQAGVRLEQALTTFDLTTTGNTYRNDYFSIFPSAFVAYKPTETTQLKMSYSKRINRPGTWAMNPFISQEDPLFRRTGNPYLRPEYMHSFEFTASGFTETSSLSITPYFRRTTDVMRRIARIDTNGVTTVSFENLATSDSWGGEMVGTLRIGDWFNGMLSGGAFHYVTDASNVDASYSSDAFGWNLRGSTTFTLMQGLDLQITYFYRAPMKMEGGEMGSHSSADIAVTQKLFGDRGRVGLRVSDPFNTMGFDVTRESEQFYQEVHNKWRSRNLFLSFSYTFGTPDRSQRRNSGQQRPSQDAMDMEGGG